MYALFKIKFWFIGTLGGLIAASLLLAAVFKYHAYKQSLVVHDFKATLQSMAASGEIDQALLDQGITGIPREVKRSNLTMVKRPVTKHMPTFLSGCV